MVAESGKTLHCTVMTPEGRVFDGDADFVVAPASDGEVGILPRHAPLITALGAGALRVRRSGEVRHWLVIGGFLEVLDNHVSVLAHRIEARETIDVAQAERAMEEARAQARQRKPGADEAPDPAQDPLVVARARLQYARAFPVKN